MLPYFAASGHNLYTKSTWMFVKSMFQLRKDNPEQYRMLQEYLFIRRTDKYWAALSPDLVIEKTLMRSIKANDGRKRGRGMTGLQQTTWTSAMPTLFLVNERMQNLTGLAELIIENLAEAISSRRDRDLADIEKIVRYIEPLELSRRIHSC